jgi:hypothetical protein
MRRIVGVGSDPRCRRRDISIVVTALAATCWTLTACSSGLPVQDAAADMHPTSSPPGNDAADTRDSSADGPDSSADRHPEVLPPPVDAPADRNFIPDGGVCLIPIDAPLPFECRPTFGDGTWRSSVCPPIPVLVDFVFVHEQVCAGYLSRSFDLGTHRWTCYYDPTSGTLVAGTFVDDTNDLCDSTTAYVAAGEIPPKGTCGGDVALVDPCNIHRDGGADADGARDAIDASGGS